MLHQHQPPPPPTHPPPQKNVKENDKKLKMLSLSNVWHVQAEEKFTFSLKFGESLMTDIIIYF